MHLRTVIMLTCAAIAPTTAGVAKAAKVDWSAAANAFAVGEGQADMVFTRKTAARCVGRWMLHADAVDDGAFPYEVSAIFPEQLGLPYAINAADFFRMEVKDEVARREAADQAEALLRRVLAGKEKAFRLYFEQLGRCSTQPEAAGDNPGDAVDAPVGE